MDSAEIARWEAEQYAARAIIPTAIRDGVTVYVGGLPADLTKAEARKLANVVMAYAVTENVDAQS